MLRAKVLETMLYGCITWSPRACRYDTLRRAHHRFLTRCIGWRKHNRADHPVSYLDTLLKKGSESIGTTLRRRRILFAGFVARMEDTRLPKCMMFGEMVGGAGCVGATKKNGWGVSLTISELSTSTPTSGRLQPRTRGNGSERQNKGRNISWQNGSLQRNQGWTTACSGMPEIDRKDQEEDSPKQAGSCWFARPCGLATSGANLYPMGVSFDGVLLWCYVCFVLLHFRLYGFVEAAALRSIVLQYAGLPIATRVSFFFFFLFICLFGDVAFSEYFLYLFRFLFIWRILLPSYVLSFQIVFFLPCDHGLDF